MKHIKRRLLALLLVVLQVVSIIPTNSFAQVSPISQVQITIDSTQAPGMWLSKHYYIVVGTGSDNYQYKHLNDNTNGTWTVNFNPALGVNSGSVHVLLKYFDKNTWEPEPTDTEIKSQNTGHPTVFNLWNTWSATIDNDAYSVALQDHSTDDLTRYAFTFTSLNNNNNNNNNSSSENSVTIEATPGLAINTTDILGDAYRYGIVTLDYYAPGESESSFATQRFHSGGGQLGDTNARSNSDTQYWMLGEWLGSKAKIKGHNAVITLPEGVEDNIDFTASDFTKVYELIYRDKNDIDTDVANMVSGTKSSDLYGNTTLNGEDFPNTNGNHLYLDFTSAGAGTFYITVPAGSNLEKVISTGGQLHLSINSDQRVVFNMQSSDSVTVAKYMMSLDGGAEIGSDTLVASGDYWHYVESVVFNCPNASGLNVSSSGGIFLAPKADASAEGVGGGWMVSKKMTHGCEWHNVNGDIPTYHFDSTVLEAVKHINGQVLTDDALNHQFTFTLYEKVSDQWTEKQSVTNTGSSVTFDAIKYENVVDVGTHYYKITESQEKVTVEGAEYTPDTVQYYAEVVVTKEVNGNDTTYRQQTKYYSDEACTIEHDTVPVFNNTKEERGGLKIQKILKENGSTTLTDAAKSYMAGTYTFTIYTDANCTTPLTKDGNPVTVSITIGDDGAAVTSDEVTDLTARTYYIKETSINKTGISPVTERVPVTVVAGKTGEQAVIVNYTNNYSHAEIGIEKKFNNWDKVSEFDFRLSAVTANAPMPAGVENDGTKIIHATKAADTATFGSIAYEAAGEYEYRVEEIIPTTRVEGVTYDETKYLVKVKVDANTDGTKTISVSKKEDKDGAVYAATTSPVQIKFTNSYAENGEADIQIVKGYNGDEWPEEGFKFKLTGPEGAMPAGVTGTTKNVSAKDVKEVDFGKISYAAAGDYEYTIEEVIPTPKAGGITYDETVYNVKVNVVANLNGTKTVTVYSKKSTDEKYGEPIKGTTVVLDFENKYKATGDVSFNAKKVFKNGDLAEKPFTIKLTQVEEPGADGKTKAVENGIEATAIVDNTTKDQTVVFERVMSFIKNSEKDETGEYWFQIEEVLPEGIDEDTYIFEGVKYDPQKAVIKVTVTDNYDGTLKVEKTKEDGTIIGETDLDVTFTNEQLGSLKIKKEVTLNGAGTKTDLVDGTYTFTVISQATHKEVNGETEVDAPDTIKTVTITIDGGIAKAATIDNAVAEIDKDGYVLVKDLRAGDYTVTEDTKDLAKKGITLISEGTQTVKVTNNRAESIKAAEFTNNRTYVQVSKVDATSSEELKGATIQVLRELVDGETTDGLKIIDKDGKKYVVVDEWISTDKAHVVENLTVDQTYILHEEVAPLGYTLTADTTFTIQEDGSISATATITKDGVLLVEDDLEKKPEFEKKIKDTNDTTGTTSDWIDSADYDIGDEVPYKLSAKLANNVTDYKNYHITFHDTMEKSLTFKGKITEVDLLDKDGKFITKIDPKEGEKFGYELTSSDHAFDLKISWGDGKARIKDTNLNEAIVEVYFTATLNDQAVLGSYGNVNTAKLEYTCRGKNEQGSIIDTTEETDEDSVIAFTYKVDINKVDDAGDPLKGAEFKLEKKLAGGAKKEIELLNLTDEITVFTFNGLDDGDYVLTETKVPNGHKGVDPIEFTVTAAHAEKWDVKNQTEVDNTRKTVLTSLTGTVKDGVITLNTEQDLTGLTGDVKNEMILVRRAVKKVWKDEEDRDGYRNKYLTVKLLANGEAAKDKDGKEISPVRLENSNNWAAMVTGLPMVDADQKDIVYTWSEEGIDDKVYTMTQDTPEGSILTTLTNTHEVETTEVSVKKVWKDSEDATGKRPDTITVQLFANGKLADVKDAVVTLGTDETGWTYKWENLKKNENGKPIVYSVDELEVPEGYIKTVTPDAGANVTSYTITNTLDLGKLILEKKFELESPEGNDKTKVPVVKIWDDNYDRYGNRPTSVTVHLYADGTEVDKVELHAGNNWKYTFTDLPRWRDEKRTERIEYTISEDPVRWYRAEINGYNIRNIYTPELTSATVRKVWQDQDNIAGMRPTSIAMTLSDGTRVLLNEENGWTATVTGLQKYINGQEAVYTWSEQEVVGYVPWGEPAVDGSNATFTNHFVNVPHIPNNLPKAKVPGDMWFIFEEYETALGGEILINHVGDCFD